jgi:hypothetical protein
MNTGARVCERRGHAAVAVVATVLVTAALVATVFGAYVAVATAAAAQTDGAGTSGRALAGECATSGLVVWLNTVGNGTAGSIYYTLEFTNLSGHACTLHGYPGVSALGLGGQQLGSAASFDHTHAASLVTLARGATATATLRIVEAGNFPASVCHQVSAAALRVYPPDQTRAAQVPFPFAACARKGPVFLTVAPAQRS